MPEDWHCAARKYIQPHSDVLDREELDKGHQAIGGDMSKDAPLKQLLNGFGDFRSLYLGERRDLFKQLVEQGQAPKVLVIGCSDSRVDPALLTSSQPGDLFVVRNVAAIVPPFETDRSHHGTSSAIEFAVRGLKVEHIVVLGHQMCGGVQALGGQAHGFDFLDRWVSIMACVREAVDVHDLTPEERQRALEQGCVLQSLRNLMTFPWIRTKVEEGSLALHGWYFDLKAGDLLSFAPDRGHFYPVSRPVVPDTDGAGCEPGCACRALSSFLAVKKEEAVF